MRKFIGNIIWWLIEPKINPLLDSILILQRISLQHSAAISAPAKTKKRVRRDRKQ